MAIQKPTLHVTDNAPKPVVRLTDGVPKSQAPADDVTWQERRIAELEQAVKERDAMIRILRDRLAAR
jgi:hypothetical protein